MVAEAPDKTVSVSVSASPVPALLDVTGPVLLTYAPVTVPVTGTTMVQVAPAASVTPEIANELPPLLIVTVPPQVLDEGVPALLIIFAGYVSVKATPVIARAVLLLVSSKVIVVAPLGKMTAGSKVLLISGG